MTHYLDTAAGREISIEGQPHLYFGGTSYLGLQTLPGFQKLLIKNIKRHGTNHGASRKSNIRFSVYDQAEKKLAAFCGAEACLSLSSGFLAGQLVSNHFNTSDHDCFYAPRTHVAVHQRHTMNFETYNDLVKAVLNSGKTPVVFCDAIDFLGTNYPDFEWLGKLNASEVVLVADDSHGLGIIGEEGEGIFEQLSAYNFKDLVVCSSMGKGFGIQAGIILGSNTLINELKSTDWFAASSPASPAGMATFLEAQTIYREQLRKLRDNLHFFISRITDLSHFQYMTEYPTFNYSNELLTETLFTNKIVVTDFKYPNEDSSTVSRIVLSAHHEQEDMEKLTQIINSHYLP